MVYKALSLEHAAKARKSQNQAARIPLGGPWSKNGVKRTMLIIVCTQCGKELQVPEQYIGQSGTCKYCGKKTLVAPPPRQYSKETYDFEVATDQESGGKRGDPHPVIEEGRKSLLRECPYCAETIQQDARICKHCKTDLTGGLVSSKPDLKSLKDAIITIVLLLIVVGLLFMNFHVITGENVGFKVVRRSSFGFSEFIINVDAITGMPWFSAKTKYPLGCKVLEREGMIESDDAFKRRIQDETEQEMRQFFKDYP